MGAGKMLVIAVIVSALFGMIGGYGAARLTASATPTPPVPQDRDFYVFTIALDVNESVTGVPHDVFTPDLLFVNQGDHVTIHFYNTEDEPEDHTFTMAAPYGTNMVLSMNESDSFAFTAGTAGIFAYRCTFHQPTMTGYLVVHG